MFDKKCSLLSTCKNLSMYQLKWTKCCNYKCPEFTKEGKLLLLRANENNLRNEIKLRLNENNVSNRQICITKSVLLPYSSYNNYLKNIFKKNQRKLRNGGVMVIWNKWNTCPSIAQVTTLEYPCKARSSVKITLCSGILLKSYPVILCISTNHRLPQYDI